MAYSGSAISTGRNGEDIPRVKENLGKLFGESPMIKKLEEREGKECSKR
jgi:hypothetical protein